MTRTEACQYAHEVRLRRNPCGDCHSCRQREEADKVNRITAAIERVPVVSIGKKLNLTRSNA